MSGFRDSKPWRAILVGFYVTMTLRVSDDLFGSPKPWWGVILVLLVAAAIGALVWRNVRVLERDSDGARRAESA